MRKIIACRTPALGCHLYTCPKCQRIEVVPHSCKSRFCPTCGKHATDRWAESVLNDLLEVPYHHLVVAVRANRCGVLSFNRPGDPQPAARRRDLGAVAVGARAAGEGGPGIVAVLAALAAT